MTLITGTAGLLDGTLYRNATLKFFLNPQAVRVDSARLLFPTPIIVQSDSNALVSFRLAHGEYTGVDMATKKTFAFTVPDEDEVEWTACVNAATPLPETETFAAGQLTGTLQPAQVPAFTGDVTSAGGSYALTIAADAVTNAKLANMAAKTIKANLTGSSANPTDATVAEMRNLLMQLDFATRAELTAWAAANTAIVGLGAHAGGVSYRYTGSGTVISDLPGWVPYHTPSPAHWSTTGPGSGNDNTAALTAWAAWLESLVEGAEGFLPGGVWRHTAPIAFLGERARVIRGIGGNIIDGGSRLEYIGTALDAADGALQIISNLNYEFRDICFVNRTASVPLHINVNADADPALSSHFIRFHQCSMIDAGSGSITTTGILLAAAKFVVLDGCNINYNGHYGIICGADDDTTIISGQLSGAEITNCMIFNDIGLYRAVNVRIEGNSFETKVIDGGAGCIVPLGELKSTGISIRNNSFIDDGAKTETRPAITTSSYAGTINLAAGSGWEITGNSFRNRLTSIDVRGSTRISANMFMQRTTPAGNVGIRINSGVSAAASVVIDSSNDFSMADANGMIAIEDNRTGLADQVIISQALAVDLTLPAVGSYQTVLTGSTNRALRGGKYRVTYSIPILTNSAGAGNYRAQLLIGGTEYDTVARATGGNSEYITLSCSRIIKLAGSVNAVTCNLRVEQSSGTASLVRALTFGSTFFQIEELP